MPGSHHGVVRDVLRSTERVRVQNALEFVIEVSGSEHTS
jgi:hypothetical protein